MQNTRISTFDIFESIELKSGSPKEPLFLCEVILILQEKEHMPFKTIELQWKVREEWVVGLKFHLNTAAQDLLLTAVSHQDQIQKDRQVITVSTFVRRPLISAIGNRISCGVLFEQPRSIEDSNMSVASEGFPFS